jgi:hypothetical protein
MKGEGISMGTDGKNIPDIESFNLADLDVTALDSRLELTAILPQYIICEGNCPADCGVNCTVHCGVNTSCVCHSDTQ